jgi:hypothetical protein
MTTIDANGAWTTIFSTVMKESNNIMNDAKTTDDWLYHGIAKFIFGWSYSIATDAWGPIPFTDAFNKDIREPKYDEQKGKSRLAIPAWSICFTVVIWPSGSSSPTPCKRPCTCV